MVNVGVTTFPITNTTNASVEPLFKKYLMEISWIIIIMDDSEISDMEKSKSQNLIDYLQCEKHGKYDFGSYKRLSI
ncbi:hypothetical protein PIROE2DRAFT_3748 [Piromyces sp. E2]|nr:hypothetical protein PIROE2DRAFT_3748 [Piromyces sp. E2]|eukprot:OUM68460.1 hypothetical protein PIROE2DRAFT_3748 [Piromyces sp. E2]